MTPMTILLILMLKSFHKQMEQRDLTIQNLLNRLQSQDIQTFQRLENLTNQRLTSSTSNESSKSVSMSDLAEAQRYAQRHGFGDVIFTEDPSSEQELTEMFEDLGYGGKHD